MPELRSQLLRTVVQDQLQHLPRHHPHHAHVRVALASRVAAASRVAVVNQLLLLLVLIVDPQVSGEGVSLGIEGVM
jgi:hypothetical protein